MKYKKYIFFSLLSLILFFNLFVLEPNKRVLEEGKVKEIFTDIKTSAGPLIRYEWNQTWGGIGHDGAEGIAIDSLNNILPSMFVFST